VYPNATGSSSSPNICDTFIAKALIANFADATRGEAAEQRSLPVWFYGQTRSAIAATSRCFSARS
jgi:hypothetical protein